MLALAGCDTVAPNIALPIPTGYRAGASSPTTPLRQDWVTGFGSAELNRLVAIAQVENLDIEAALARINEAEAQAVIAGSALFPSLGGTADVSRQQGSGAGLPGGGRGAVGSNRFGLGLTASYELDLFGRNRFAAQSAEEVARTARFDRDTIALATTASVANTYFAVVSAQDRLRIAEDNLRIANRVLETVRTKSRVGTGTGLDIAQQESLVATQRARIPPLVQQVGQNRNVLAVLMGRTPESVFVKGGSLDALRVPSVRPGLPSELLLRRPDIAAAEATLASAELSIASARAAFFPSIQLTGSSGVQSLALRSLFGPNAFVYSVAAGLTQPIFDGYALQGQLDFQQGRAAEFAALYRRAIVQSFADVENALIAVRQNTEFEVRQREAVAASRRALTIVENQLTQGTIDVVTLFTVQTTLFNAQDALVQARLLRFQALASLFQALGGGWTQDRAVPLRRGPEPGAAP
ncbi:efflux transporter outer membrane subunit [uncultured Enterovirga sp.]|uniref:efflux transporter outer membrane subunit n=1 Tax=uncultured Enterovirga sp. TaxID=2026352 RepID=UPI0035C94653